MKLFRLTVAILTVLFLLGTGAACLAAAENWTADPQSGAKICVVLWSAEQKLVSASWTGPTADGKAEGSGTLRFASRDKEGKETAAEAQAEMKVGRLDGKVSIRWSDGDAYEGYYKEGLRTGSGVYRSANGTVREGEWQGGQLNGKGRLAFPDGRSYEGDFVNDMPNGKVFYKLPDGRTYEGQMVNAVFQGKGVMKFPNGTVHDGDWANGAPNGKGAVKYANGTRYEGDFAGGKRSGKGVFYYADGSRYEGDFLDDLAHGSGTLYGPDGKVSKQGKWEKDKFVDGAAPAPAAGNAGMSADADTNWATDPKTGAKIGIKGAKRWTLAAANWTGPVADGRAEGKGTLTLTIRSKTDGATFNGTGEAEMKAGLLNGRGSFKWSDGEIVEGDYVDGYLTRGTYKYANGQFYEGEFRDGVKNGYGVMKDAAGNVIYAGMWKDDHPDAPPKTDNVLGVPWGATEDEARKSLLARPGTTFRGANDAKIYKECAFVGPYNDETARIQVIFREGKMFAVMVELFASEDEIAPKFDRTVQGLSQRYGQYASKTGKYLDAKMLWEIGGGYAIALSMTNEAKFVAGAGVAAWQQKPFGLVIAYTHQETWNKVMMANAQQSGRDY